MHLISLDSAGFLSLLLHHQWITILVYFVDMRNTVRLKKWNIGVPCSCFGIGKVVSEFVLVYYRYGSRLIVHSFGPEAVELHILGCLLRNSQCYPWHSVYYESVVYQTCSWIDLCSCNRENGFEERGWPQERGQLCTKPVELDSPDLWTPLLVAFVTSCKNELLLTVTHIHLSVFLHLKNFESPCQLYSHFGKSSGLKNKNLSTNYLKTAM